LPPRKKYASLSDLAKKSHFCKKICEFSPQEGVSVPFCLPADSQTSNSPLNKGVSQMKINQIGLSRLAAEKPNRRRFPRVWLGEQTEKSSSFMNKLTFFPKKNVYY